MKKLCTLLMVAMVALFFVACGGKAEAEKDLVSVSIAKENDVISLSSILATDGMSFEMIHASVDGLMDVDGAGNIVYALAESHTESADGLVYTFKLRDAVWSNGSPVKAQDFVFAWREVITTAEAEYNYLFTSGTANVLNADAVFAGDMDKSNLGIKAIDDKTLEVTLSQKTPYFLGMMAFPVFFPINEEFFTAQGDNYAMTPEALLACGPYQLKTREVGTKLVFAKNPTYWDAANVKIDELVINIVPEVASSVTAYVGGAVDFTKVSSSLIDGYKNNEGFTQVLEGYLWYLQPDMNDEKYANRNFRMALAHAVNKDDLVNNILKDGSVSGYGFVPSDLATGPDGKDFRATAGDYVSYDPELAVEYFNKALAELGTDSLTISLLYENADPAKTVAEYLQSNLQSVLPGLTVEMDMQTKEARLELQRNYDFDMVLTRWGPDYADPTTYLNLMLTGNSYNYGLYSSEAFDAKMIAAGKNPDLSARWAQLLEAEEILMNDMPVISVFQVGGASLIDPTVSGIEAHAVGVPYVYKNLSVN